MNSKVVVQQLLPFITEHRKKLLFEVLGERTLNIAPVLENIYDRGNTSAVMRSAEAYGFANFNIIESPETKFKAANRVTKGTDKWLEISKYDNTRDCLQSLKQNGFQIYATHLDATTYIEAIDFTKPTAIILGNEKDGVSAEALKMCKGTFKVPMFGFAQSFNISVAAAICFSYIHRQRCEKLGQSGDLSEIQFQDLLAQYLIRTVGSAEKILDRLEQESLI